MLSIAEHLSENGLQRVAILVDLVAIGTSVIIVHRVLFTPHWFVLLYGAHKLLPIEPDLLHKVTLEKRTPAPTQILHTHFALHILINALMEGSLCVLGN